MAVNGSVVGEFRVESSGQNFPLLNKCRLSRVFAENFNAGTDMLNNWSANKNHFDGFRFQLGRREKNIAGQLAPIAVAENRRIEKSKRSLQGILNFRRQQDRARAGSEDWLVLFGKFLDLFKQAFVLQEFQLSGTFAARQHQRAALPQVDQRANFQRFCAEGLQHRGVRSEVPLNRQNSNFWFLRHQLCSSIYQPRVESMSFSSIWRTSRPGIASPSSSLASSTAFASSKWVVALTTALARASGSLDLKIPEPTNTASAPRLRTSAASAGVAIPPAEKFGTGNFPVFATWRISSSGAPSSFASRISSSSRKVVSFFIWTTIVRMWRTASTTLPEPASPLVRIIAAPSPIRRRASPRFRAPQTNGMR